MTESKPLNLNDHKYQRRRCELGLGAPTLSDNLHRYPKCARQLALIVDRFVPHQVADRIDLAGVIGNMEDLIL